MAAETTMKNIKANLGIALLIGGLVLVAVTPASAWQVAADFITGGGYFFIGQNAFGGSTFGCATFGSFANFGWHGGVKNGQFWGNGNYLDHGCGLHVHNTQVRDYICVSGPCPSTTHQDTGTREVCGNATSNFGPVAYYRVRMNDTEPESAKQDKFGISLYDANFTHVYIAQGAPIRGGNIELHKGNPSNTAPAPSGFCDFLRSRTIVEFSFS
jgi:hypothetical protein